MRLLALLGLVAIALANPTPEPYTGFCTAVVDNRALLFSNFEAFFDVMYPAYETLCSSLGVTINRAVVWTVFSAKMSEVQGELGVFTIDQCVNELKPGNGVQIKCRKYARKK